MGELVQISISYVRELRRSILNANKQVTSNTIRSIHFREPPLLKRSMSIQQNTNIGQYVPKSSSSSVLSSKAAGMLDRPPMSASSSRSLFGRNRFRSMTIPENDREDRLLTSDVVPKKQTMDAQKRRNSWFTSISIIKSLSSNSISPFLRGKGSLSDSFDLQQTDAADEKAEQEKHNCGELKVIQDSSEELANEIQPCDAVDPR